VANVPVVTANAATVETAVMTAVTANVVNAATTVPNATNHTTHKTDNRPGLCPWAVFFVSFSRERAPAKKALAKNATPPVTDANRHQSPINQPPINQPIRPIGLLDLLVLLVRLA
jgi:hypothetical protein